MFAVLPYPDIDPVIIEIGPFALRWYAMAYVAGLVLGWRYMVFMARRVPFPIDRAAIDDFLVWATIGVLAGGRLGFVLFYEPLYFLDNPLQILMVWTGGMAFHGGMLGVILAIVLFGRRRGIDPFRFADLLALGVPVGLFFGRVANFINAELWGHPTDVAWAMVFPGAGPEPRHPSQLYEAFLEGIVLFVLLTWLATRTRAARFPGVLCGTFLAGYGIARYSVEFFRVGNDSPIAFVTMGQLLSLPMVFVGAFFVWRALRRPAVPLTRDAPAKA